MGEEITQQLPNDGVKVILLRLDLIDSRLDRIECWKNGAKSGLIISTNDLTNLKDESRLLKAD